ncbi:MAG TPA: methyltransferase [Pseudonocardia sp.]|nr:methyltransferase [Pseudonocardia sp.]
MQITERTALSGIAYGFIASKALFAALELDLFTLLADGPAGAAELAARTGVAENRMRTLLHALAALGLLVPVAGGYANAPAAQRWLVRGVPGAVGEYYRLQIGRQIYPALTHLDAGLAGTGGAFATLTGLLSDPAQARTFTEAQHAGSLGAARVLAGRLDGELAGTPRLLDVGGGSGAFAIAFAERAPGLRATVLDLPEVVEVARGYRAAAGLTDRIDLLAADAVRDPWPPDQDVVLLSYLLSAVGDAEIDVVLDRARGCLRPGGLLVVHDFMLDDGPSGAAAPGPVAAALWFLHYLAYHPDTVSFCAAELTDRLRGHGFGDATAEVLIPGITSVVRARPAGAA